MFAHAAAPFLRVSPSSASSFSTLASSSRRILTSSFSSPFHSVLAQQSNLAQRSRSKLINSIPHTSTTSSSSLHTRSFFTSRAENRPSISLFNTKSGSKTSSSRAYTSSSSPSSSSSTTASSHAAKVLTQDSATVTATAAATHHTASSPSIPLTFHEEMTRVRFSYNWWKEWTIIMGVFAVTGSSTVMVVKPVLKEVFKLEGSMSEGPWSFRIAYLCTTLPLYSCVLLTVATIAGRRPYFKMVVLRMWGRLLPKKALARFQ